MERAARRRIERIGEGEAEPRFRDAEAGLRRQHGREQRPRIGVLGPCEELGRVGKLDNAAEIHDGDARGDVLDDRQVVADEHVSEIEIAAQIREQVQDLRLHRDIERRGRLVADDDLGPHDEGAGDGDALALPAGQLARIAVHEARRQADALEHRADGAAPLRRGADAVHLERQGDDGGDAARAD